MKLFARDLHDTVIKELQPNKVSVILGARRTGKTFLLNEIQQYLEKREEDKILSLDGEDARAQQILKDKSIANYKNLLAGIDILIIDEAQKIPEIGITLKLIVDHIEGIKIIASGSSMFDLHNQLGEPLTGRKFTYYLYPLAQCELSKHENVLDTANNLDERLILGSYPELWQYDTWNKKEKYLRELVNSYLLKDILVLDNIRNSSKLLDLLRLIAFQIGKEVSYEEIGKQLGFSKQTVERYLDLLSKVFVIFRLGSFSRNLRKEIAKKHKWYFYDNGIRNTLIANFNPIALRQDIGELWENYLISERIKLQSYNNIFSNNYFWRTYDQQEIDWIEERQGKLLGYEIKWKPKKIKAPKAWITTYPEAEFEVINSDNYLKWIT